MRNGSILQRLEISMIMNAGNGRRKENLSMLNFQKNIRALKLDRSQCKSAIEQDGIYFQSHH